MIHCNIWSERYKKCKCSRKQETYKSRSLLSFFQQEHQHNCADKRKSHSSGSGTTVLPTGFYHRKEIPSKEKGLLLPPDKDPGLKHRKKITDVAAKDQIIQLPV